MTTYLLKRWFFLIALLLLAAACGEQALEPQELANSPDRTMPDVPLIASYDIDVSLDTDSKQLDGRETIYFRNATDDPIDELVFHLYLNGFRDQNSFWLSSGNSLRGFGWDENAPGWIEVASVAVNGEPLEMELIGDDTLARVDLPFELLAGDSAEIQITFTAQLPRAFARTGFGENDFYMVGQWFPKLGVWQNGAWNAYPFYSNNEFFADFGAYNVNITVPEALVVGASGVPTGETVNSDGTKTLSYRAEPVIDFAWTASPHFQIATREVLGTELQYLYLLENGDTADAILDVAAVAVVTNSDWFGPYPYERLTLVDVPIDAQGAGGMEYPTLVTVGALDVTGLGVEDLLGVKIRELVAVHEVGHQWFQSMAASNEVEEPWLDEGMTDYATTLGSEAAYGATGNVLDTYLLDIDGLGVRRQEYLSSPRVPMFGASNELTQYSVSSYSKPNMSLVTLQRVLGDEMMKSIMRTYFMRYRFQHPTTEDFRAVAQEVSGQELAWFFDGLVYGDGVINYRLAGLTEHSFVAEREGTIVIPVEILVTFADGTTDLVQWDGIDPEFEQIYPARSIASVEIDPEQKIYMDLQWADNGLSNDPALGAWLNIITRWLYKIQDISLLTGGL
ncbi:MAG: M1 family metallopeptidase [Candidatus Promineifilaceae bacterium]